MDYYLPPQIKLKFDKIIEYIREEPLERILIIDEIIDKYLPINKLDQNKLNETIRKTIKESILKQI